VAKGNWDHQHLVKYLVSAELKPIEIERLKVTSIWPREVPPTADSAATTGSSGTVKRYLARELLAPTPENRELGLAVIKWTGKWRHGDDTGAYPDAFC
jgi:hypothetical protein